MSKPNETRSVDSTGAQSLPGQLLNLPPLSDQLGRIHRSLRISVTDACNIRCRYCMPESVLGFLPQSRLMSFSQIEQTVRLLARCGISKIRLTGGEPLMRPGLHELVAMLDAIPGIDKIALTTNAIFLPTQVHQLVRSGLTHINISLDTLRESAFQEISRRTGIAQVLQGIEAAIESNVQLRLNALLMRDINLEDCIPLAEFALQRKLFLRFIEFMPLDADRQWNQSQVVTGAELRSILEMHFGRLVPCHSSDSAQPSSDYQIAGFEGGIGFIDPVSNPFCQHCDRLRLTADGKFRNCLFGQDEWNVKELLDSGGSDAQLEQLVRECIASKHPAHGISSNGFQPPERAMYQIGG